LAYKSESVLEIHARRALLYSAALTLLSPGCIETRLVSFDNLAAPLPMPEPGAGWRRDMSALFERYENAPVVAPEDERLGPLFGGLTTLSYFGADAEPKMLAQQLGAEGPARGQSLETACGARTPSEREAAEAVLATSGLPAFAPVWIPLSTDGGAAPDAARCDERGKPLGAAAERTFCVFGRLALQPADQHSLVVVVHGLFDSGAQEYAQRMAAVLYQLGHSVLVPDMRDHGDTLRAAPQIATTLGTLEGSDLLALVNDVRQACGERIGRAGLAGVSGGGLDAIRAFTLDRQGSLDAGAIAISPLLDVDAAIRDAADSSACPLTRSVELSWTDDLTVGAATGAIFFGAASLSQALAGQRLDANTALVAGIGAGAGLLTALAVDAWFDGGNEPCVSQNATARILQDVVRVRWRTLRAPGLGQTMSPAGRRIDPQAITLDAYVRERAQFLAARSGVSMRRFDAVSLSHELHSALPAGARPAARLLVIGAQDDPVTRIPALEQFVQRTAGIPQVYARALSRGGHAAMWVVQPVVMRGVFERFFDDSAHSR
jgi:predicted alpha/beta-fold hydrolase